MGYPIPVKMICFCLWSDSLCEYRLPIFPLTKLKFLTSLWSYFSQVPTVFLKRQVTSYGNYDREQCPNCNTQAAEGAITEISDLIIYS